MRTVHTAGAHDSRSATQQFVHRAGSLVQYSRVLAITMDMLFPESAESLEASIVCVKAPSQTTHGVAKAVCVDGLRSTLFTLSAQGEKIEDVLLGDAIE